MRTSYPFGLLITALLTTACMHNGPTDSVPVEPPRSHFSPDEKGALSATLPEGWTAELVKEKPRTGGSRVYVVFRNPTLEAVIFLDQKRTDHSPYEEVAVEREALLTLRRDCSPVQTHLHAFGVVASFVVGARRSIGKIAAVRMHQDQRLLTRVFGAWPASQDAQASGDFDYIVANLKPD